MRRDRSLVTLPALETWPAATLETLSPERQARFRQNRLALLMFAQGEPIAVIEQQTQTGRKQLYNMIRRALTIHADGLLFGFRALLPGSRVKRLERMAPLTHHSASMGGNAGAMSHLLGRYPELVAFLRAEIKRTKLLFEATPDGDIRLRGLGHLHGRFLVECRKLGLRDSDYPLVKDQQGIRALSSVIKKLKSESFQESARAAGAPRAKGSRPPDDYVRPAPITRPLQAVEFDGHKLDLRISVTYTDSFGFEQAMELTRVWILVVVDVRTRAILGYELVLAPEYNRHDVIRAVQKAIEPQSPFKFNIPGLGYGELGGFPSQRLPELAYAVWEEFRFDNAKANLAADTVAVLCNELGCIAHAGPAASPDHRAIIERFFLTLTRTMSHRLPATTGSNPDELRRMMNAAGAPSVVTMPLADLEQLIEAVLGSLNGTLHSSLGGRTPLQALEYFIRGLHTPVHHLPEPMRRNLCLLQIAHPSRVGGSIAKGMRPSVSFHGVRYSSASFAERTDLIGQRVLVYYNPDDISTIRLFASDGGEIGVLRAGRPWDRVAHSLRMRRRIQKLIRDAKIRVPQRANPVEVYLDYIRKQAPKSRRKASELVSGQRIADAPSAKGSRTAGPRYAADVRADADPAPPNKEESLEPVKPRTLSIPSGFNR